LFKITFLKLKASIRIKMEQTTSKPKNLKEFVARSLIVRIDQADLEKKLLIAELAELRAFKKKNVCVICQDVIGEQFERYECIKCGYVTCDSDYHVNGGVVLGHKNGVAIYLCADCDKMRCNKCLRQNIKTVTCVCDIKICNECSIVDICMCGAVNLYCSEKCAKFENDEIKTCTCGTVLCAHNEAVSADPTEKGWKLCDNRACYAKICNCGLADRDTLFCDHK